MQNVASEIRVPEPDRPTVAIAIKRLAQRCGGAERVLVDVSNELARRGFKVEVWHHESRRGAPFFPLNREICIVNTYPKRDFLSRIFRRAARLLGPLQFVPPISILTWLLEHSIDVVRVRKTLQRRKPDVVVAFQPDSFTNFLIAARGTNVPVIVSIHNVPKEEFENPRRWDPNPVDRYLRKRCLKFAAAVSVLLDEFRDQMPERIRDRVFVVPNMIGQKTAGPSTSVRREKMILCVGRLAAAKDHESLIRAVRLFPHEYADWMVEIFGEGPLEAQLRALVAELELESRVKIHKSVTDIQAHYPRASIFCIPSFYEGFGLVTAEALQAGLPVVGFSDCPGTNMLVRHNVNGLLVQGAARSDALAEGLCRLMASPDLRRKLGGAGPSSVSTYSVDSVGDRWESLILSVLSRRKAQGANLEKALLSPNG